MSTKVTIVRNTSKNIIEENGEISRAQLAQNTDIVTPARLSAVLQTKLLCVSSQLPRYKIV
jgi:hypothetical protein